MNYEESIEFLYNSLPVFQRVGAEAYKPGLGTSLALAEIFGNPERKYPCIHIAGTNGKGSTAHTLAAILMSAGYKVGLYTSPHIFDFRERIRVDGEMISSEAVTEFVNTWIKVKGSHPDLSPSFFELTSTLAFAYFARNNVDVAVIETGLGGRLDSTNIITPVLSVITNISLDHTALLGDTLEKIAFEKAGIIKPGVPVVIGERQPETESVFIGKASMESAPITFAEPVNCEYIADGNLYPTTPFGTVKGELKGFYQVKNAATVFSSVLILREIGFDIPDSSVKSGMADVTGLTHLFGRWSKIGETPLTIADTGHNYGGWEYLVRQIKSVPSGKKAAVLGFVADKDLSAILDLISASIPEVELFFSSPSVPRGLKASELAERAAEHGLHGTVIDDVNVALEAARASVETDGFVIVAGSNFLIADIVN